MSWFLDRMDDAREVLSDLLPEAGEQFTGAVRKTQIEGDRWNANWKAQNDLTSDMIDKMGGFDVVAERFARENPMKNPKQNMDPRQNPHWVLETAKDLMDKEPELWGDLPRDMTSFDTAWKARLGAERNELTEMMGRGDAPWTQFAGEMIGSFDDIDVATAPLGGAQGKGVWGFAKFLMTEGLIGAASEVPAALAEQDQAKKLGFEEGDFWTQIALGGAFGAGLAGVLGGGGKALEYAFGRRKGEDLAASAAGEDPLGSRAKADAAEEAMRRGEPPPPPALLKPDPKMSAVEDPAVQNVLTLISRIEAPKGIDQVSDFTVIASPRPLSRMTVDEVLAWQQQNINAGAEATAAGAFQIKRSTLEGLKTNLGLKGDELFDEATQRKLAVSLMEGRGLEDWRAGRLSNEDFANALAQEWAALPVVNGPKAGQSYYGGDGLNNAQVAVGKSPYDAPEVTRTADDVIVSIETEGKTRDKPVSEEFLLDLRTAVAPLGDDIGVSVVSGGQDAAGTPGGKRTGSERHDVDGTGHSHTADVVLTRNGKPVLPGEDPELYERFLFQAAKVYPGIGHYDWGVHVGGGSVAAWGPDTTGKTLDPRFGAAIAAGRKGVDLPKGEPRVGGDTFLGILGGETVSEELLRATKSGGGGASSGRAGGSDRAAGAGQGQSFEELFGEVSTPAGTRVEVKYRVVDLADLRKATGDLQPRDRSRAASDDQVTKIARDLDPTRLMPGAESDRGAPIIGPDMIIESGNGRVLGITRAAELHPERYQAYVQSIRERGFNVPDGMKNPVLVGERTTDLDFDGRRAFVRESNTSAIARMSGLEQAKFDADYVGPRAFEAYRPGSKITHADNAEFVRRVFSAITPEERGVLIGRDGRLSAEGKRRLTAALFARAFDADELLNLALEAEDRTITNLIRMMEDIAPNWAAFRAMVDDGFVAPEFDLTNALTETIRIIVKARTANLQGQSIIGAIRDRLAQADIFSPNDPMVEALIDVFYRGDRARPAEVAGDILDRYMAIASRHGREDAPEMGEAMTPFQAIRNAIGEEEGGAAKKTLEPRVGESAEAHIDIAGAETASFDEGAVAPDLEAVADETIAAFAASPKADVPFAQLVALAPEDWTKKLAEGQPFKTMDDAYAAAGRAQDALAARAKDIEAQTGASFKNPGLKDRAEAEEKLGRKGYDSAQDLTDISRAGFTVSSDAEADAVIDFLAETFDLVDEGWVVKKSGYADRKLVIRHDDGTLSELQMWSPEMYAAKRKEEVIYTEVRKMAKDDPAAEPLKAEARAIYAAVADFRSARAASADGISSVPKLRSNLARNASSEGTTLAVRQTSQASTSTQGPPDFRTATANIGPDAGSNSTAGRFSQDVNVRSMSDASVAKGSDNSRMGADPTPVNPDATEVPSAFDFTDADGSIRNSTEVVERLNNLGGLEQALRSCQLKGNPQ